LAFFRRCALRACCFSIVLASGIFAWGSAQAATVTILIKNISVVEGNTGETNATFTLTLSGHSSSDVHAHFATSDGTAHAPTDYVAASGDVTVPANGSAKVNIHVNGDKTPEPDETFYLSVVPKNGTVGDGKATATILNDDGAVSTPAPTPKPVTTPHPATTSAPIRTSPVPSSRPSSTKPPTVAGPIAPSKPGDPPRPSSAPKTNDPASSSTPVRNQPGSTSGPTLSISTYSGATSGPAGSGLVLHGTGWTTCGQVVVTLGRARLGVVNASGGSFDSQDLSIPGGVKPGRATLTAACSTANVSATSSFDVVYASLHRSEFATSLHNPTQVSFKPKAIAESLVPILLLTLLLGFVTELFNSTYEENHDEIRSWVKRKPDKPKRHWTALERGAAFFVIVLVGGILCAFVTPDVGLNLSTVGVVAGMCIALVIVTIGFDVPNSIVSWRHFGEAGEITAMPSTILVAAACVFASRIVHFEPGLLYGLLAVLTFRRELGSKFEGKLGAIACGGILALSLGAWFALIPITSAAQRHPSFLIVTLEATLASVCLLGLESLTFVLMPVRFMMGPKIKEWNKYVWFVLFVVSAGMYVHVLLRPGLGYVGSNASVSMSVIIFAIVPVIGSIAFWSYFRFRPEHWVPESFRKELALTTA